MMHIVRLNLDCCHSPRTENITPGAHTPPQTTEDGFVGEPAAEKINSENTIAATCCNIILACPALARVPTGRARTAMRHDVCTTRQIDPVWVDASL
jgi:hypothetical protein